MMVDKIYLKFNYKTYLSLIDEHKYFIDKINRIKDLKSKLKNLYEE